MEDLRQQLAAIEHQRWSDWQRYMHDKMRLIPASGGDMRLWKLDYDRWEKQITTPYAELSEGEKVSDMEQVDRYWPLIQLAIDKAVAEKLRDLRVRMVLINDDSYPEYKGYDEATRQHMEDIDAALAALQSDKEAK